MAQITDLLLGIGSSTSFRNNIKCMSYTIVLSDAFGIRTNMLLPLTIRHREMLSSPPLKTGEAPNLTNPAPINATRQCNLAYGKLPSQVSVSFGC